jgi:hypothetical protein
VLAAWCPNGGFLTVSLSGLHSCCFGPTLSARPARPPPPKKWYMDGSEGEGTTSYRHVHLMSWQALRTRLCTFMDH